MTHTPALTDAEIRRRILIRQILVFGGITTAICTVNIFTTLADHARVGEPLQPWEPVLWEYSSAVLVLALIPLIAWLHRRAPLTAGTWRWAVPLHLAATPIFSILHVTGMVLLRKLGYLAMHGHYSFGPLWPDWLYEYRKDFVTYALILAGLQAFRTYRLWLESRREPAASPAAATGTSAAGLPGEQPVAPIQRLVVKKLNREFILNTADIDRIDADGNYVTIHAQGATWPLRESLSGLERKLDPKHFARVHRRHIVNLDRIREIQPWDSGDYRIMLADGNFVNFSRRYRSRLPQLFN
ncbi:MAG TPA: LytTR family DNA-binding domain-containing protein [Rhodanobacteraceae bacterium]|nr:LytTR family DNA-binding domain-containing protein [Rhodanobacteraceae bacterium]